MAEKLANGDSGNTISQESLENLWNQVSNDQDWAEKTLRDAKFAETVRAANKLS